MVVCMGYLLGGEVIVMRDLETGNWRDDVFGISEFLILNLLRGDLL